jgi:nitrogenase molybdenum-iron protein NifN
VANIIPFARAASTNPLKSSQPLGAALAFLGVEGAIPLFHGSQGCTSFALVLLVRHFKETIPLQTTAMDEVSTILGGADHLEEAILNLKARVKPEFIGVCTTALVETRGEDFAGDLALIRARRKAELGETVIALAQTPDFTGSIEEGWAAAAIATIRALVPEKHGGLTSYGRVNILPGSHLTVADIDWLRDITESFGLAATILPDISGALDGTVKERWVPTSYGGTKLADIRRMGEAVHTIAIGEHMRGPAEVLREATGVGVTVLPSLTGLQAADRFVTLLAELTGRPVPPRVRRARFRLVDAMLDGHFHFGGKRLAIAGEPDMLASISELCATLGAEVAAAVAATGSSPALKAVPAAQVHVGDLGLLEELAQAASADLIIANAHANMASERLGVPLFRLGFPIFDRLGTQHQLTIGYEGAMSLIFAISQVFQAAQAHATPASLNPFTPFTTGEAHDRHAPSQAH